MTDEQIEIAALSLAKNLDYPWSYMTPKGREEMRETARDAFAAATAPLLAKIAELTAHCAEMEQLAARGSDGLVKASQTIAELDAKLAQRVPDVEALTDKIASLLAGTYHCTRVWSAWGVGTMSEDDFCPVDESDTPAEISREIHSLIAAAPAAPEQQEPNQKAKNMDDPNMHAYGDHYAEITEAILRDVCELEPANPNLNDTLCVDVSDLKIIVDRALMVAQAPNAQQAELPPGWKTVVVPEDVGPEPDWEDVRHQAETATGIELPRAVFSIVIREVRRWMAAQQAEAQEPFAWAAVPNAFAHPNMDRFLDFEEPNQRVDWTVVPLFTRPKPAQLQRLSAEEVRDLFHKGENAESIDGLPAGQIWRLTAEAIQSAIAAKNGVNLK